MWKKGLSLQSLIRSWRMVKKQSCLINCAWVGVESFRKRGSAGAMPTSKNPSSLIDDLQLGLLRLKDRISYPANYNSWDQSTILIYCSTERIDHLQHALKFEGPTGVCKQKQCYGSLKKRVIEARSFFERERNNAVVLLFLQTPAEITVSHPCAGIPFGVQVA